MKCVESQDYMMKYFDRELNDIEEAQLKQHLKYCSDCQKDFLSYKEIFTFVEEEPGIEPPEDFELQVMNRIEKELPLYHKSNDQTAFVFNILLVAVSFVFVILFGSTLWEELRTPANLVQSVTTAVAGLKEFSTAAMTLGKGIVIAVISIAASLYKTYYYAYILLGILFLVLQKIFIRMVKEGYGGAQ